MWTGPNFCFWCSKWVLTEWKTTRITPPPSDGVQSSCTCNHCREIPSDIEKLCCRQTSTSSCFNSSYKILKLTYRRLNILNLTKLCTKQCLSCFQDFQRVVLDDLVFLLARRYTEDIMTSAPDADLNTGNRHSAYRQFILWHHDHLGARKCRVYPNCCVWNFLMLLVCNEDLLEAD